MNPIYETYLQIIRGACTGEAYSGKLSLKEESELAALAQRHFTEPFLHPYIKGPALSVVKSRTKSMMYHYYQIEHFTEKTVELLEKEGIACFLLKGISLAAYYPMPEQRKLGDIDLYVRTPEELEKAKKILETWGYKQKEEVSDHHLSYTYTFPKTGRTYILELHFCIVGRYQYKRANQVIEEVYHTPKLKSSFQIVGERSYRVLPPTEYTFYMVHHMLRHYLYSGFGIRLLCDFTLYLKKHEKEINFQQVHKWCMESRIFHLYEIILESCRVWLGLQDSIDKDIHYNLEACSSFMEKVLADGDIGLSDGSALVNGSSYEKVNFLTYLKEGHLQMKVRFPKLSRYPFLWLVLWPVTFICFLHNTYHLRKTTFRQTLADFRQQNHATQITPIFDNSRDDR